MCDRSQSKEKFYYMEVRPAMMHGLEAVPLTKRQDKDIGSDRVERFLREARLR